jgi:branched-chain amino acid transport system permease protein
MIGAMVAFSVITALAGANTGLPPVAIVGAGVVVAVPICMAVGYTLERVAYRPLRTAPRLAPLITAIGLSIILQNLAMIIWTRNPIPFPQIVAVTPYHITGAADGATITNVQIVIIVTSVAIMAGLLGLIYRTKLGTAMRATSQNQQIAGLMGININTIIALTFVIGAALAAVAGVMVGTYGIAHYQMGFWASRLFPQRSWAASAISPAQCWAACCSGSSRRSVPATSATSPTCARSRAGPMRSPSAACPIPT